MKHLLGETQVTQLSLFHPNCFTTFRTFCPCAWQDLSTGLILSCKNDYWYGGGKLQVVQLLTENKAEVNMVDQVCASLRIRVVSNLMLSLAVSLTHSRKVNLTSPHACPVLHLSQPVQSAPDQHLL